MPPYLAPAYHVAAFNCPTCGAFAEQRWLTIVQNQPTSTGTIVPAFEAARCYLCKMPSIWFDSKMIYPLSSTAPLPNEDMPKEVKEDFMEARTILNFSPRGTCALLRLAIQKLCVHLGGKGDLNADIGSLVKRGLPEKVQKALDTVRVIGNNAVHPGQLDLKDDPATAQKLFGFINIICDYLITQPKNIDSFYDEKVPDTAKDQIDKRDKGTKGS